MMESRAKHLDEFICMQSIMKSTDKANAEQKLCADLIACLEKGVSPWRKPWSAQSTGQHRNPISGAEYTGANPLVLEMAMSLRGTDIPLWAGFSQLKSRDLYPRKGSRAALILRPELHHSEKTDENGETVHYTWTSYKTVNVFNLADCEGNGITRLIDEAMGNINSRPEPERLDHAEQVLSQYEVQPVHGGSRAFYVPALDRICMPARTRFESSAAYYATLIHEMMHSTGAKSRLNRDLTGRMGGSSYAVEELVAELGSYLVCRRLEINSCAENHAAYLSSWISVLKESPNVIWRVLSQAKNGADLICPG
jgi:antirestriction protein ArdC